MRSLQVVLDMIKERKRALKRIETYLQAIKNRAKEILGEDTKVYVFGSYVRKDFHPFLSDIDVLVVSPKVEISVQKIVKIKEKIVSDIPDIFEIHLADEKVFEYYRFFCKDELREIV